ncbi:MAG: peptidoglycan DD-metalloendopeptidase family protein [Fimbriimonadaceae bacterium]|nr:peptidoglycan DD-metalloendopeptidase family protein [Fimbriimonadaceae bacterium]QYK59213.1 MAG: peptidoglycan DD-metalloendopeptidase family protein [Fimbriimonadaceae bacterium]
MTVWLALVAALSRDETLALQVETSAGESIVVQSGESSTEILGSSRLRPVSFSSDGRWLAAMRQRPQGEDLYLTDLAAAAPAAVKVVERASEPSWAPGGRRLTVSTAGNGIVTVDLSGSDPKVSDLLPLGSRPDWSPAGGRIAFLGSSKDKGVFVVNESGESPRRVSIGLDPVWVGWSPDGRILATLATGKQTQGQPKLVLLVPGSTKTRILKKLDGKWASWAPDAKHLLSQDGKTIGVLDTIAGTWRAVEVDAEPRPQWVDSSTLAGVRDGRAVLVNWKKGTTNPQESGGGKVKSVAVLRGIRLEGSFSSPFGDVPSPKAGEVRLQGTLAQIDPMDGTATIRVMSVGTPDGMELNFAKPIDQEILVTPSSQRQSARGARPLSPANLANESEIIVVVKGTGAGVPEPLAVRLALLPTYFETEGPSSGAGARGPRTLDPDGVSMDRVVVPMIFPVLGKNSWSDTFLANRDGGRRRHHGQDIMAPKMTPLVACFDGVVQLSRSRTGHMTLSISSDDGWTAVYMHINNDTPGTDDGQGGDRYAFAPGLQSGDRVVAGQLVAFCGDSGNAENTAPHLHFELHDSVGGGVLNAAFSLQEAERIDHPVYVDPVPEATPEAGHIRWDAVVSGIDTERGVIVAELVASLSGKSWRVNTAPKKVYVKPSDVTRLTYRHDSTVSVKIDQIRPGMLVTAMGPEPAGGSAMDASRVSVALSPSR